jgi:hypothetical protein
MDGSDLSPRFGTHQNSLLSHLHGDEADNAIHDPHSPIVETTIPKAKYHIPNFTIARMLFTVYGFMLLLVLFFSIGLVTAFFISPSHRYSIRFDDNSPTKMIRVYDSNRPSNTVVLPLAWHYGYYLIWILLSFLVFALWDGGKRIDRFGVCHILLSFLSVIALMVWMILSSDELDEDNENPYEAYNGLWRTGVLPAGPSVCAPRLEEKQRILLDTEYYSAQFARVIIRNDSDRDSSDWPWVHLAFNETRFLQIRNNTEICYQGFEGNQDLYGLGVRLGIYLQWITSFLANNLLPAARQAFRGSWLVFSIAMCILAFVASIANYCVFGIEIEILYWLYWGGFVCVCASAPSQTRLGGQRRWVDLDWDIAVHYTMHTFMAYHGLWFSWWGYDQAFARLPCGTYHFIFAKVLDPSVPYCYARDALSALFHCITIPLLVTIPFVIIIMAAELKASIKYSAVYRIVFGGTKGHSLEQGDQNIQERDENISKGNESEEHTASVLVRLRDRCLDWTRSTYCTVRDMAGMPEHRLGGIRLITPVDIRHRRFVHLTPISLTHEAHKM